MHSPSKIRYLHGTTDMKARIIAPNGNFSGNLLWRKAELPGKEALVNESLKAISAIGYWASPFPEGDGVTFRPNDGKDDRTVEQMLADFQAAFPWLDISASPPGTGNLALAELEAQADSPSTERCTVIVPVLKLHFEESLDLGPFRLVCARQFDPSPNERLSNLQGSYLQFDIDIPYADLLRLNRHVSDGDVVILQCLARAEQALDVIRFGYSSFKRPEYTPNPAGQLESGFYAAEIIPIGKTHLRPIDLAGISRPMSASNNWLGPQIDDSIFRGRPYLEEILHGRSDELALAVKGTLRFIRQAFYSLGDESRFLTLVFALDGLAHPDKNLKGPDHRAYIAALTAHGKIRRFKADLERYNDLYSKVRNELVHKGKDFHELPYAPAQCCDDMLDYLKRLVTLIEELDLKDVAALRDQAHEWLAQPEFTSHVEQEKKKLR